MGVKHLLVENQTEGVEFRRMWVGLGDSLASVVLGSAALEPVGLGANASSLRSSWSVKLSVHQVPSRMGVTIAPACL